MLLLIVSFLMACGTQSVDITEDCDVRIFALTPTMGSAGTIVSAETAPITSIWDTAVYVNNERAEITEIQRDNCDACDQCKTDFACLACDDCDACDEICRTECVESLAFIVPELDPTDAQVVIYNGHGGSNPSPFSVTGPMDSGDASLDTGSIDSGTAVDTGTLGPTSIPPPSANASGTNP